MIRPWSFAALVGLLWLAVPVSAQQTVTFEQIVSDLRSEQTDVRLGAVRALKGTPYPEAAVPLAGVIADPDDAVQLEAIAAALNIYLAEKIVPSRRVGLIVEVRNKVAAEAAFSAGPAVIEPRPVPAELLTALRTAFQDEHPRVALEGVYAFGVLAPELSGAPRSALLTAAAPELAARIGNPKPELRLAAVRVIERVYAVRAGDPPVPESIGDALVVAMNDSASGVRISAMNALGALRYARGLQALTDLVNHQQRGSTAATALDAVARIAHESSAPLFDATLASKDATMRRLAVEGLARLGRREASSRISAAMEKEREEGVLLAGHFAAVLLSNGPVDGLVEGLTRKALREQAWRYLVEIAPGRGQALGVHLQDPDTRIRTDIVDVLSLSGDRQAIPAIERLLRDPDPAVARAAGRALVRIRAVSTPAQ